MQPVIRPASRDQIRCRAVRQRQSDRASEIFSLTPTRTFRSALRGGAKRLATDAVLIKGTSDQPLGQQRTIQSDRLPTSSNPSPISGRLGHQKGHQERVRTLKAYAKSTWKPPDQSSLHNVDRTGIRPSGRCKLYFLQRIFFGFMRSRAQRSTRGGEWSPTRLALAKRTLRPFSLDTKCIGGAERDRTADPLLAKQVLSQLSYSPNHRNTRQQCRQDQESSSEPDGGPG